MWSNFLFLLKFLLLDEETQNIQARRTQELGPPLTPNHCHWNQNTLGYKNATNKN